MLAVTVRRLLGRPSARSLFHTTSFYCASRKVLQNFRLADIGEGITECEIIKWYVSRSGPSSTTREIDGGSVGV